MGYIVKNRLLLEVDFFMCWRVYRSAPYTNAIGVQFKAAHITFPPDFTRVSARQIPSQWDLNRGCTAVKISIHARDFL